MKGYTAQRGKTWSFWVDKGTDASGKRLRATKGGFPTRRAAERELASLITQLSQGTFTEPSKETLGAFLTRWLIGLQRRPTTIAAYLWAVEKHIKPQLGGIRLQDLTPSRLNAHYAALRAEGVGERSVEYAHITLHRALADAAKWGDVSRNPAALVERPRVTNKKEMITWSPPELRQFLESIRDDRLYSAFLMAATTAMRRGEIMGLRWRDVNLAEGWCQVQQALVVVDYKVLVSQPKTAKGRRLIALDPITVDALVAHRVHCLEERAMLGLPAPDADDMVFAAPDGTPTHPAVFSDAFDRHVKATGLRRLTLHGLRHTWASLALQNGVHPKVVQERLGHSTVSITLDTYSHSIPAMQTDAANKIAGLVFNS